MKEELFYNLFILIWAQTLPTIPTYTLMLYFIEFRHASNYKYVWTILISQRCYMFGQVYTKHCWSYLLSYQIGSGNFEMILRRLQSLSMFDKFHLTFNFKSKVSHDVFKNKNECQLTSTVYSKMSPQFWLTQYFRKTNILNNQYAILICNQKKKKEKTIIRE